MIKLTYENVTEQLVKRVPELIPLYKDEMDYYGEIASYVFFGPILCDFIAEQLGENGVPNSSNEAILIPAFVLIEECVKSGDKELRELVLAGFLESFIPKMNEYPALKGFLGVKTEQLLSLFE